MRRPNPNHYFMCRACEQEIQHKGSDLKKFDALGLIPQRTKDRMVFIAMHTGCMEGLYIADLKEEFSLKKRIK